MFKKEQYVQRITNPPHKINTMQYKASPDERLAFVARLLSTLYDEVLPSCNFEQLVEASIAARSHRRARTLSELRGVTARMMRCCPDLAGHEVASLSRDDCRDILDRCFESPRQKAKGRVVLMGLFSYACRQGWCFHNPITAIEPAQLLETELQPLSWDELQRLIVATRTPEHRACMPAMALMLWAGVRPAEVQRLSWKDLDWEEGVIVLRARHVKTGGCRHVTMHAALRSCLREAGVKSEGHICPPDWGRRWRRLRDAAGLLPWRQDVLRHTFASYFIKRWPDFAQLQAEMGHRSATLLRTRYLSMQGLTREQAQKFWAARGLL